MAELMRHLLLHAAGNMRAHALRQIQLHDIALLAGKLADGIGCSCWKRPNRAAVPGGCCRRSRSPNATIRAPSRNRCFRNSTPGARAVAPGGDPYDAHRRLMVQPAHCCVSGHLLVTLAS
jgi:hypothetical protein